MLATIPIVYDLEHIESLENFLRLKHIELMDQIREDFVYKKCSLEDTRKELFKLDSMIENLIQIKEGLQNEFKREDGLDTE